MASIFWMKCDIDNRWKIQWVSYTVPKFHELWSTLHRRLKIEPEFSPTLHKFCIRLRFQALHTKMSKRNQTKCQTEGGNGADASRIRRRRIVNVNEPSKLRRWCLRAPKHFRSAMASRRAALSGNTSLITTFSSLFCDPLYMYVRNICLVLCELYFSLQYCFCIWVNMFEHKNTTFVVPVRLPVIVQWNRHWSASAFTTLVFSWSSFDEVTANNDKMLFTSSLPSRFYHLKWILCRWIAWTTRRGWTTRTSRWERCRRKTWAAWQQRSRWRPWGKVYLEYGADSQIRGRVWND